MCFRKRPQILWPGWSSCRNLELALAYLLGRTTRHCSHIPPRTYFVSDMIARQLMSPRWYSVSRSEHQTPAECSHRLGLNPVSRADSRARSCKHGNFSKRPGSFRLESRPKFRGGEGTGEGVPESFAGGHFGYLYQAPCVLFHNTAIMSGA